MGRKNFKKLAKELIEKYETNDPFRIAKYQNIQIIYLDFKAWLGLYTCINGIKTIYVNNNLSKNSQKFVCSHELGHGQQEFKEAVFMKEYYLFGTNKIESEANEFAATLIFDNDTDNDDLTEFDVKLLKKFEKYL